MRRNNSYSHQLKKLLAVNNRASIDESLKSEAKSKKGGLNLKYLTIDAGEQPAMRFSENPYEA